MAVRACIATEPAHPGRPNEDFAAATPYAALVIDGAGTPPGSESGCVHGVAWYSRNLGGVLLRRLTDPGASLTACVGAAISEVTDLHRDTCDPDHPGSPSATVTVVREQGIELEYLVLADSPLVFDLASGVEVICDDREAYAGRPYRAAMNQHSNGSPEHATALRDYVEALRHHRNREGGFWVASTTPKAAEHAITGTVPLADVRAAALLSDGASRLADRFDLLNWRQLLDVLNDEGPVNLIRRTRDAENSDPNGQRWPRGKHRDDATAVYIESARPRNHS